MLTEDDLRALIDAAASEAPEPEPLPEDSFRVAPIRTPRRPRRVMAPLTAAAAILIVMVAGVAVLRRHNATTKSTAVTAAPHDAASTASDAITFSGRDPNAFDPSAGTGTVAGASGRGGASTGVGQPPAIPQGVTTPPAQVPPIADSAKIIKNGSLEVRVGKGTVTESMNQLIAIATGLGGYVSETKTTASAQSGAQASATISVRVPSASFEQLIASASKLGEVRSSTTSGQDVTAQFTDIDAQLGALTATRDQLLLVLGEAKNVPDILAVQDRITQVQVQIDQLTGQKKLLTDQTAYGTLSVSLLEPGATIAVTPVDDNKDLGDAWRDARRNFGDAIENIVGASGTLAVVFLCGAVLVGAGWFIFRASRRRMLTL